MFKEKQMAKLQVKRKYNKNEMLIYACYPIKKHYIKNIRFQTENVNWSIYLKQTVSLVKDIQLKKSRTNWTKLNN